MVVWDCKSCVGTTSGLAGICIGSLGAPGYLTRKPGSARAPDPALAPTLPSSRMPVARQSHFGRAPACMHPEATRGTLDLDEVSILCNPALGPTRDRHCALHLHRNAIEARFSSLQHPSPTWPLTNVEAFEPAPDCDGETTLLRQVVDWDLRGLSLPDLVKFLAGRIPYPPALILSLLMVYRLLMPEMSDHF